MESNVRQCHLISWVAKRLATAGALIACPITSFCCFLARTLGKLAIVLFSPSGALIQLTSYEPQARITMRCPVDLLWIIESETWALKVELEVRRHWSDIEYGHWLFWQGHMVSIAS